MKSNIFLFLVLAISLTLNFKVEANSGVKDYIEAICSNPLRKAGYNLSSTATYLTGVIKEIGFNPVVEEFTLPVWKSKAAKITFYINGMPLETNCTAYPGSPSTNGEIVGRILYLTETPEPRDLTEHVVMVEFDDLEIGLSTSMYGAEACIVIEPYPGWIDVVPGPKSIPTIIIPEKTGELIKSSISAGKNVTVKFHVDAGYEPAEAWNIYFYSGNISSSDVIVITAHYDVNSAYNSQGASDSAAPVAILLEVASRLKAEQKDANVIFLLTSGGQGYFGVRCFISRHSTLLSKCKAVIQVDDLGHKGGRITVVSLSSEEAYTTQPIFSSWIGDLIAEQAAIMDLDYQSIESQSLTFRDYTFFLATNIPACLVTDGYGVILPASTMDTPEYIDYNKVSNVVELLYNSIIELKDIPGMNFKVQPLNEVKGKIEPAVKGVMIVAYRSMPKPGLAFYNLSNEDGSYILTGLPYGVYDIAIFQHVYPINRGNYTPLYTAMVKLGGKRDILNLKFQLEEAGWIYLKYNFDVESGQMVPPPVSITAFKHGTDFELGSTTIFTGLPSIIPPPKPWGTPIPKGSLVDLSIFLPSGNVMLTNSSYGYRVAGDLTISSPQLEILLERLLNDIKRVRNISLLGFQVSYVNSSLQSSFIHLKNALNCSNSGDKFGYIVELQEALESMREAESKMDNMIYSDLKTIEIAVPMLTLTGVVISLFLNKKVRGFLLPVAVTISLILVAIYLVLSPGGRIALFKPEIYGSARYMLLKAFLNGYLSFIIGYFILNLYEGIVFEGSGDIKIFPAFSAVLKAGLDYARREGWRSVFTVIAITLISGSVIAFTTSSPNVVRFMGKISYSSCFEGVSIYPAGDMPISEIQSETIGKLRGVLYVDKIALSHMNVDPVTTLGYKNNNVSIYGVISINPDTIRKLCIENIVSNGTLFEKNSSSVIISSDLASKLGIKVGDVVKLGWMNLTVTGFFNNESILNALDTRGRPLIPLYIRMVQTGMTIRPVVSYVNLTDLVVVPYHVGKLLNVKDRILLLKVDLSRSREISWDIGRLSGLNVYLSVNGTTYKFTYFRAIKIEGLGADIIPLLTSVLLIAQMMASLLEHRRHDFYILASIGLNPTHIEGIVLNISFLIGLSGAGLGVIFYQLLGFISKLLSINLKVSYSPTSVELTYLLTVGLAAFSSLIPARNAFMQIIPSLIRRWKFKKVGSMFTVPIPVMLKKEDVKEFLSHMRNVLNRKIGPGIFYGVEDVKMVDNQLVFKVYIGEYGSVYDGLIAIVKQGEYYTGVLKIKPHTYRGERGRSESTYVREFAETLRMEALKYLSA